jgi:uncharacterized membrane protein
MSDETGSTATQAEGLSDTAAGTIAYITWIPALIFLLIAPYNRKPSVKFHAIQELGLTAVQLCLLILLIIPFIGWILFPLCAIGLLILWILCIVKASQGSAFKLPVIGKIAADQSGYNI